MLTAYLLIIQQYVSLVIEHTVPNPHLIIDVIIFKPMLVIVVYFQRKRECILTKADKHKEHLNP